MKPIRSKVSLATIGARVPVVTNLLARRPLQPRDKLCPHPFYINSGDESQASACGIEREFNRCKVGSSALPISQYFANEFEGKGQESMPRERQGFLLLARGPQSAANVCAERGHVVATAFSGAMPTKFLTTPKLSAATLVSDANRAVSTMVPGSHNPKPSTF